MKPIQPQGAASPQGAMLDAEAAKPIASSEPDGPERLFEMICDHLRFMADSQLLLEPAREAFKIAHEIVRPMADEGIALAAALRQRIGRE